jgi:hypothetical protein
MITLNPRIRLFLLLFGVYLVMTLAHFPAFAQSVGYSKLNVNGRVQLEIPADWTVNDAEHRKRIKELGEKLTGIQAQHTASLSARSFPTPSRIFVRVSFLQLDPPVSQAEIRREVHANPRQVIKDLEDMWREESPLIWAGLAKMGAKEVGRPSFAVEPLGGQTALVLRYGRTSTDNSGETFKVEQYHIPLGSEKALITLTYADADQIAITAHGRLKNSILVR